MIWLQPRHAALLRADRAAGPPGTLPSGHRRFGEDDLEWLEVLRCLRDTGMPIAQTRQHVGSELRRTGSPTVACAELRREPPREGSGHESQPTVSRADHPNLHCRLSGRSPRYSHADRRRCAHLFGEVRLRIVRLYDLVALLVVPESAVSRTAATCRTQVGQACPGNQSRNGLSLRGFRDGIRGRPDASIPAFDNSVRIGYARVGTRVQDHQAPAGSASCGALP